MAAYQFGVVEFTGNKKREVGIISTRWIRSSAKEPGITTLWPPHKNDGLIDKSVKAHEKPGNDWSRHPIKVLKKKGISIGSLFKLFILLSVILTLHR
jgi:hypothetical protein